MFRHMFNNNGRRTRGSFLWGLLTGIAFSFYLFRWIGNKGEHEQKQTSTGIENQFNNMDKQKKDEMFNTFMNASEEEIKQKTEDLNLNN